MVVAGFDQMEFGGKHSLESWLPTIMLLNGWQAEYRLLIKYRFFCRNNWKEKCCFLSTRLIKKNNNNEQEKIADTFRTRLIDISSSVVFLVHQSEENISESTGM
jgi:hypothetical protein